MPNIIERLEAARGPSKEIDHLIAREIGWHRVEPRFTGNKHGAWISPEDFNGTMSDGSPILDGLHGTDMHRNVPNFTASIDAALTLMPESFSWALGCDYGCWARAFPAKEQNKGTGNVCAASSALALCIAALRAREVLAPPQGGGE